MRRFEFEEGGSSKFWEVAVEGAAMTVRFGKIGTDGQTKTKSFGSDADAKKEADKLVLEKTKKGYSEVGASETKAATVVVTPAAKPSKQAPVASTPPAAAAAASPPPAAPVAAVSTPSATLASGEAVRFAPYEGYASNALKLHGERVRLPKPAPFAKVFEGLNATFSRWLGAQPYPWNWTAGEALAKGPALDLMTRVRERVASGVEGDGFDDDLEAATWSLACTANANREKRTELALANWTARTDAKRAALTLIRGSRFTWKRVDGHDYPQPILLEMPGERERISMHNIDLAALREHLIGHDGRKFADVIREAWAAGDDVYLQAQLARLLDDADAAAKLLATNEPSALLTPCAYLARDAATASKMIPHQYNDEDVARIVMTHGLGVAEAVLQALESTSPSTSLVRSLGVFPSLRAARLLTPMLEAKATRRMIGDQLANMPAEALVALREARSKKTKYADALDSLIATIGAAAAATAPSTATDGSPSSTTTDEVTEAPLDALPKVLVKPPWREKRKAGEVVRIALKPRSLPVEISFEGYDRAKIDKALELERTRGSSVSVEHWTVQIAANRYVDARGVIGLNPGDLERLIAGDAAAKANWEYFYTDEYGGVGVPHMLAKFGKEAVALFAVIGGQLPTRSRADLAMIGDAAFAPKMVEWAGLKAMKRGIARWTRLHPSHAAAGLIPIALGETGSSRDRAEQLLSGMTANRDVVLAQAAAYGDETKKAIEALLDRDPLLNAPSKAPNVPDTTANLPAPRLRDGRALPREAVNAFVEMIAFSPLDPPYAGIAIVKEACDPRSIDVFTEGLIRAFVAAGMLTSHEWMVRSVALLGSDASARFLYSRALAWAADNQRQRAMCALEVLGALGSDVALSLVGRASRTGQRAYFKERAGEILAEISAARGLTPEELEDRTAPDLELNEDGSVELDFGPRRFRVGFDEHLAPFVATPEGERLAALPRATKTDDAAKSKAASETWKTLKAEAEKVARDQVRRLELMLSTERRVDREVFLDSFAKHPLIGHLTRRLVWGAYDASNNLVTTFRIAEDRSFASADDEPLALPDAVTIGLIHPLRIDKALLDRWSTIFGDYAIVQPFPQLGRPAVKTTLDEIMARFSGKKAPTGLLYALRNHGFHAVVGEGGVEAMSRSLGAAGSLYLSFDPWIVTGQSAEHTVSISAHRDPAAPSLDDVQLSELAYSLERAIVR